MGKVFLLNELMPAEEIDGVNVQKLFVDTIKSFSDLYAERKLGIEKKILTVKEPQETFICGSTLKKMILDIGDRDLKTYAMGMFLHGQILADQYHVDNWPDDLVDDLLNLTDDKGKNAMNEGIASVCSWGVLSLPVSEDLKKDDFEFNGKQNYQVLNYYGQNKKNVVYNILDSDESNEAMELKLQYALDLYQIHLTDEFKEAYTLMRVDDQKVMISRLVKAEEKKCLVKQVKDDNLLRECTCTRDKNMFELKSNSELGIRFFFKVFDSKHIVFSLIGHKSDYGDKSKKKKGATAQNKDMMRALQIANHYMESRIKIDNTEVN